MRSEGDAPEMNLRNPSRASDKLTSEVICCGLVPQDIQVRSVVPIRESLPENPITGDLWSHKKTD